MSGPVSRGQAKPESPVRSYRLAPIGSSTSGGGDIERLADSLLEQEGRCSWINLFGQCQSPKMQGFARPALRVAQVLDRVQRVVRASCPPLSRGVGKRRSP